MQTRSRARATSSSAASTSPAAAAAARAVAAPLAAPSGSSSVASARRDTPASVDDYDIDDYADSGSGFEYESDGPVASHNDDTDSDIIMVESTSGRRKDQSRRLAEPVVVLSSDEEPPPEPAKPKGKLTSRKQFAADLAELSKKFNSTDSDSPVSGTYLGAYVCWPTSMELRRRTRVVQLSSATKGTT